jgi:hypothetical protein
MQYNRLHTKGSSSPRLDCRTPVQTLILLCVDPFAATMVYGARTFTLPSFD